MSKSVQCSDLGEWVGFDQMESIKNFYGLLIEYEYISFFAIKYEYNNPVGDILAPLFS